MKKKRILIITILSITCLAVCLIAYTTLFMPKVTGVTSLVAANIKAQSKVDNYHMDGDVNMDINLDYEEYQSILNMLDLKLPVKMTLSTDAGRESAHVITDAEVIVSERKFRCNHLNYTWI